jgi:two-component system nitrate/nitrite sensor histidine kinase NarX
VQESYDDVRELLVHFRTRIGSADLETALNSALEKFEGQTNVRTSLERRGTVPNLSPEQVLQVMHIVQESLSNVRKHAKANRVDVELSCDRECALIIHDDGVGFDASYDPGDTHVGLRIMRERAHRIGAGLSLDSAPMRGTKVRIELPCRGVSKNTQE